MERRFGRFKLTHEVLEDISSRRLTEVFRDCIILRAEHLFMEGSIVYDAYNYKFDLVPNGQIIPDYKVNIYMEDEDVRVEWQKVSNEYQN